MDWRATCQWKSDGYTCSHREPNLHPHVHRGGRKRQRLCCSDGHQPAADRHDFRKPNIDCVRGKRDSNLVVYKCYVLLCQRSVERRTTREWKSDRYTWRGREPHLHPYLHGGRRKRQLLSCLNCHEPHPDCKHFCLSNQRLRRTTHNVELVLLERHFLHGQRGVEWKRADHRRSERYAQRVRESDLHSHLHRSGWECQRLSDRQRDNTLVVGEQCFFA